MILYQADNVMLIISMRLAMVNYTSEFPIQSHLCNFGSGVRSKSHMSHPGRKHNILVRFWLSGAGVRHSQVRSVKQSPSSAAIIPSGVAFVRVVLLPRKPGVLSPVCHRLQSWCKCAQGCTCASGTSPHLSEQPSGQWLVLRCKAQLREALLLSKMQ